MSLVLTAQELFELTDKKRPTAQMRVLQEMHIPCVRLPGTKGRPGRVKVLRVHARILAAPAATLDGPEVLP